MAAVLPPVRNSETSLVIDPLLIRMMVVRGAVLWLGVRVMLAVVGVALYGHVAPGGPTTAIIIAALTGVLALVDQRRRGEVDFFCNLGISRTLVAMLAAVPALAAEAVIRVAL